MDIISVTGYFSKLSNRITVYFIVLIITVFFILWLKLKIQGKQYNQNKNAINYYPSLMTSLGVLGTFVGITIGLLAFNPADIDGSIEELLSGLRTAFLTSITGMILSAILSWKINTISDLTKEEKKDGLVDVLSNIQISLLEIEKNTKENKINSDKQIELLNIFDSNNKEVLKGINLINNNHQQLRRLAVDIAQNALAKLFEKLENNNNFIINTITNEYRSSINDIKTNLKELLDNSDNKALIDTIESSKDKIYTSINSIIKEIEENSNKLDGFNDLLAKNNTESLVRIMESATQEFSSSINDIKTDLKELLVNSDNKALIDTIESSKDKIYTSINSIIEEIEENSNKLDGFNDLLAKNNTESLVRVMESATQEFSSSMHTVIERLVQENFAKLNDAVENMVDWQYENRDAIDKLIKKYKAMDESFNNTSTVLTDVSNNTKRIIDNTALLLSDDSVLNNLIVTMKGAMIDDNNFSELSSKLSNSIDKLESTVSTISKTSLSINSSFQDASNNLEKTTETTNNILLSTGNRIETTLKNIADDNVKTFNSAVKNSLSKLDESSRWINELCRMIAQMDEKVNVLVAQIDQATNAENGYWETTRKNLEENLFIIAKASQQLKENLNKINDDFYSDLNATLMNLDECISSAMEHYKQ